MLRSQTAKALTRTSKSSVPRQTARRLLVTAPKAEEQESYPPPNSSFYDESQAAASSSPSSKGKRAPTSADPLSFNPSAVSTFGAPASLLSRYTSVPPTNLSLKALLQLSPSGSSPPQQSQVHESALFTSRELPIRLARRVAAFRALPFIVGANPLIGRVARYYAESFEILARWRQRLEKGGPGEELGFVESLRELVERHRDNVPTLARGFLECRQYMSPAALSTFLDEAIHARIGIRLIAEQHLALASTYFSQSHSKEGGSASSSSASSSSFLSSSSSAFAGPLSSPGTIHTDLSPYSVLKHVDGVVSALCQSTLGTSPELLIEGHKDATYVGVPVHLEYVLTELLKNSYRASVELKERLGENSVRPVKVTIAKSRRHVSLRIRDRGGGIHPRDLDQVFSYAFTTAGRQPGSSPNLSSSTSESGAEDDVGGGPYSMQSTPGAGADPSIDGLTAISASGLQSGLGTLAGLGYGLPMARLYTTFFGQGAELAIVSLWGYGTDTFVRMSVDPVG
ncbi:unnamed protein product [Jaminaea pallidilutea]